MGEATVWAVTVLFAPALLGLLLGMQWLEDRLVPRGDAVASTRPRGTAYRAPTGRTNR